MTEGTARVVAPAALALFAVLGALMTDRATPGAVAAAAVATGIGVGVATHQAGRWSPAWRSPQRPGVPRARAVVEPVLDGVVRRHGLGRPDVRSPGGRRVWRSPCRGAGRRVGHGHRRTGVGRLVRRDLVHHCHHDLRPSAAARHGGAEGSPGQAGREVPRRGAHPDRRRGARRHRPRADGVCCISGARLALDEDPQEASFAPGGRAADQGQPRGGTRHRGPDAYRFAGPSSSLPDAGDLPALVESFRRAGSDVQLVSTSTSGLGATRAGGVPDRAGGTHQRHQARARPTGGGSLRPWTARP